MDPRPLGFVAAASLCAGVVHAQSTGESPNALSRAIFQELIEINTTDSVGNVTTASEAMAKRLRAAGFADSDIAILGPNVRYIDDNGQVQGKASDRKGFPPPPLRPDIMKPLESLVARDWPGLKVVPSMSDGASDGVFTSAAGLPTYTVTGIEIDKDNERAHGQDERLGVESFYKGNEFFYQYLRALTSP